MNKVNIGDVFVFVGNPENNPHYDNFELGKKYIVSSMTSMYDFEGEFYPGHDIAVTFQNCGYGTFLEKIHINFVSEDDYRDGKIESLGI